MGFHHQIQSEGQDPQSRVFGRVRSPLSGPWVTRCGSLLMDDSFERCLTEPVAVRPDDVLEGILIQFLKNLKPTLRNLS